MSSKRNTVHNVIGYGADGKVEVEMDHGQVVGVRANESWREGASRREVTDGIVEAFNDALAQDRSDLSAAIDRSEQVPEMERTLREAAMELEAR